MDFKQFRAEEKKKKKLCDNKEEKERKKQKEEKEEEERERENEKENTLNNDSRREEKCFVIVKTMKEIESGRGRERERACKITKILKILEKLQNPDQVLNLEFCLSYFLHYFCCALFN